jgi:hypothetical protein
MMKSMCSLGIFLLLLAVVSMAHAGEKGSVVDLDLDSLRWKNRVLVILSPTESDLSFQLQKEELASSSEGVLERDLMILEILEHGESRVGNQILSGKSVQAIRKRLGVQRGSFQILLIGKDGGVKLRSSEPVSVKDIFGLIDSMPMRRQEMESEKK